MSLEPLIALLDGALAPLGFARRRATWNRSVGAHTEVIDVQPSKAGDRVTMNVGALERGVYATCWGHDPAPFVEEPECIVRARIGQLLDNRDRWWEIDDAHAQAELVQCLYEQALPFLTSMRSLERMRDRLRAQGAPSPRVPLLSIGYAVLVARLGDPTIACSVLAELEASALGAWKGRAKEVSGRIGCREQPARC